MKVLILLLLVTACASRPDYEELYYECALDNQSEELEKAFNAFDVTLKELKESLCREYPHDEEIQDEFCKKD